MSIPFNKYVDITSGVGGGAAARQRDLILRLFTANEFVPPQSYIEMTDADQARVLFGSTSGEYKRAAFYFSFISKLITKANKISFARWVQVAVAPKVFGNTVPKSLATYAAVANGSLKLTMGANTHEINAIDLTGAGTLAAVAATIQTAIRAQAGAQFAAATVAYDATSGRFNLVGGATGDAAMAVLVPAAGTDLAPLLGWTVATDAIIANGSDVETLTDCVANSAEQSNNFATFAFVPALDADQRKELATWNATQNQMFMYCARASDLADAMQAYTDNGAFGGVGVTLDSPVADEYPELLPAAILAATDYSRRSTQNYMYQQAALTPSVTTASESDALDLSRCNYYGQTQTGGQRINFYQRGVLMGGATDATDMNVYANEIWLKDAAGARIMSLLLALPKVSANRQGRAQLRAVLQDVIDAALTNGVISVGKPLNVIQKLDIIELSNDPLAWVQVQNSGYWVTVDLQSYVTQDSRTEWKAVYTLIYSKDDTVRKVEGSHILI